MPSKKIGTKNRILKTAAKLFRDFGYEGTSTRMIADKAKVNIALINYHFGDKRSLYMEVVRFWGKEAFKDYPMEKMLDPVVAPEEKVRIFIKNTLLLLFGDDGKGTGLGLLLARECAQEPSDLAKETIASTIGEPTMALKDAVGKITGIEDDETLRAYTSCIVGQTVYFFLSRNFVGELFGAPEKKDKEELEGLTEWIYSFSMSALDNLKKSK